MVKVRNPARWMGAEEQEGFNAFAQEHYREMMIEAFKVVKVLPQGVSDTEEFRAAMAVFDKMATPRVFLIERWDNLDPKERMAYYPDRAELEKKAAEVSSQAQGMITT